MGFIFIQWGTYCPWRRVVLEPFFFFSCFYTKHFMCAQNLQYQSFGWRHRTPHPCDSHTLKSHIGSRLHIPCRFSHTRKHVTDNCSCSHRTDCCYSVRWDKREWQDKMLFASIRLEAKSIIFCVRISLNNINKIHENNNKYSDGDNDYDKIRMKMMVVITMIMMTMVMMMIKMMVIRMMMMMIMMIMIRMMMMMI